LKKSLHHSGILPAAVFLLWLECQQRHRQSLGNLQNSTGIAATRKQIKLRILDETQRLFKGFYEHRKCCDGPPIRPVAARSSSALFLNPSALSINLKKSRPNRAGAIFLYAREQMDSQQVGHEA
jgi:hypothetical protein